MRNFLARPQTIIFELVSDRSDLRLRNLIYLDHPIFEHIDVGIVGIPFDLGVELSKGRIGAALAPEAIRYQIKKYGTVYNIVRNADFSKLRIIDFGNIVPVSDDVGETHDRVTEVIKTLLSKCGVLIVLGGGNDLTFATVRALSEAVRGSRQRIPLISGMNVDAHLDVREVRDGIITSGTPYRRLIDHKIIKGENLFEVGIQGHVNSKAHWDWAKKQGVRIFALDHARNLGIWKVMSTFASYIKNNKRIRSCFVSIDIDSVAQAFAPGSSSPSPDGLFPNEILDLAYTSGTMPSVRLFEIMEVNPKFDEDNRTARLVANIILEFLAGYTQRSQNK